MAEWIRSTPTSSVKLSSIAPSSLPFGGFWRKFGSGGDAVQRKIGWVWSRRLGFGAICFHLRCDGHSSEHVDLEMTYWDPPQ
ncbi:unnamed protein product [Cuscuta campestris]|uniref:Uncharacterized protein n=1 Tax=Cuscuta campestris TaxID=132261 RepID=A0A484NF68_9ASTE|nr:unnamed protein product [Cuscuta campestris]